MLKSYRVGYSVEKITTYQEVSNAHQRDAGGNSVVPALPTLGTGEGSAISAYRTLGTGEDAVILASWGLGIIDGPVTSASGTVGTVARLGHLSSQVPWGLVIPQ